MKKSLAVLALVLAVAACAVYVVKLRRPEKRACARAADLCGLSQAGAERCVQTLQSLGQDHPDAVVRVASCVADAQSCGGVMGCASGAALSLGTGLVRDFVSGLQKTAM